jgi:uncharacterized protein HemY
LPFNDLFGIVMAVAIIFTIIYVPLALIRRVIRGAARMPRLEREVRQLRAEVDELRRGKTGES